MSSMENVLPGKDITLATETSSPRRRGPSLSMSLFTLLRFPMKCPLRDARRVASLSSWRMSSSIDLSCRSRNAWLETNLASFLVMNPLVLMFFLVSFIFLSNLVEPVCWSCPPFLGIRSRHDGEFAMGIVFPTNHIPLTWNLNRIHDLICPFHFDYLCIRKYALKDWHQFIGISSLCDNRVGLTTLHVFDSKRFHIDFLVSLNTHIIS